jgi:hypothetical protein
VACLEALHEAAIDMNAQVATLQAAGAAAQAAPASVPRSRKAEQPWQRGATVAALARWRSQHPRKSHGENAPPPGAPAASSLLHVHAQQLPKQAAKASAVPVLGEAAAAKAQQSNQAKQDDARCARSA